MRIFCLLILLVAGLPVMAQQTADQEPAAEQQEAEQAGDNSQDANGQSGAATPDEGDEDEAGEEDDQTGRFIPSEQISRDLGVSFPTDI